MRRLDEVGVEPLRALLAPYGLTVQLRPPGSLLSGSYWGEPEAGLIGSTLMVRDDTPLHSALHEAAHFVCMDPARRDALERDAGGDFAEEDAVCYLQIVWGGSIPGVDAASVMADMDAWGYTFRLGSAARWFAEDAEDARRWLVERHVLDATGRPTGRRVDGSHDLRDQDA